MKQKLFMLLFAIWASIGSIIANGTKIGDLYYSLYNDHTAEVTYGEEYDYLTKSSNNYANLTTINVPSEVEYNDVTYTVTGIGEMAFMHAIYLTSINLSNTIKRIGGMAFEECYGLVNIEIPASVNMIEYNAFRYCQSLTSIEIPNSVTYIGSGAFDECISLYYVSFSQNITDLNGPIFHGCKSLTIPIYNSHIFVYMPDNFIGAYTILDGIKKIAPNAFNSCNGLTTISIPSTVKTIGSYAFQDCEYLTSVNISNGVENIEYGCFSNCKSLQAIVLPESIKHIGWWSFYGCTSVASITSYRTTPPALDNDSNYPVFGQVNKTIPLNVPQGSFELYSGLGEWSEFSNLQPLDDTPEPLGDYTISYLDKDAEVIDHETITLNLPEPPTFKDFTFLRWDVVAGQLTDGINILAVYKADTPTSAPEVVTNPANPAQKLIHNGNIYILTDDSRTYTLTGQRVK